MGNHPEESTTRESGGGRVCLLGDFTMKYGMLKAGTYNDVRMKINARMNVAFLKYLNKIKRMPKSKKGPNTPKGGKNE